MAGPVVSHLGTVAGRCQSRFANGQGPVDCRHRVIVLCANLDGVGVNTRIFANGTRGLNSAQTVDCVIALQARNRETTDQLVKSVVSDRGAVACDREGRFVDRQSAIDRIDHIVGLRP